MSAAALEVRPALSADIDAVNQVIEAAIMGWDLAQRVKRLALPSYRYSAGDLAHIDLRVAARAGKIIGVLACEPADVRDAAPGRRALLVHGLYVHPDMQRRGVGSRLLDEAVNIARAQHYDGVLIRAQAGAEAFYRARGLQQLPDSDGRAYAARYWLAV